MESTWHYLIMLMKSKINLYMVSSVHNNHHPLIQKYLRVRHNACNGILSLHITDVRSLLSTNESSHLTLDHEIDQAMLLFT